jgi:hypothetical protein
MPKIPKQIQVKLITGAIMCCLLALPFIIAKITKSNSASIFYVQTPEHDGGDTIAIRKLNELVEENFLNRNYYEAAAYTEISTRWYANYNKHYQALLITGDPASGWSYFYYATPQELKMVADRKISCDSMKHYLKPFPVDLLMDCPTRSRDLFSIF